MVGIIAVIIIKLTVGMNNLHNDFCHGKVLRDSCKRLEDQSFLKRACNLLQISSPKIDKLFGKNLKDCHPFGVALRPSSFIIRLASNDYVCSK